MFLNMIIMDCTFPLGGTRQLPVAPLVLMCLLSLVIIFSYSNFYFSGYVGQLNIVCSLSKPLFFSHVHVKHF